MGWLWLCEGTFVAPVYMNVRRKMRFPLTWNRTWKTINGLSIVAQKRGFLLSHQFSSQVLSPQELGYPVSSWAVDHKVSLFRFQCLYSKSPSVVSHRKWEEGRVLIFDDSFEHEVWQDADSYRMIFIVDVWHPELTQYQRQTLSPI